MTEVAAEPFLTLREVCGRLRISRETAYRWIKSGKLKGTRVGRGWRFTGRGVESVIRDAPVADAPLLSADLFAGAGGLSLGFEMEGFRSVFFNDIDSESAFTFQKNFPMSTPFVGPIQDLSAKRVFSETGIGEEELDVLVGGPPCQGFSINAPVRSDQDERNHLFRHYVRLVLEGIRPKFIVFENVPGLVSHQAGRSLNNVCSAFRAAGYEPSFTILNACHYGVPQERWRLLIVANRVGAHFDFPSPTHFSLARPNFTGGGKLLFSYAIRSKGHSSLFDEALGLSAPVTIREAIGDLPHLRSGGGDNLAEYSKEPISDFQTWARSGARVLHNHHCVDISSVNRQRMKFVKPGGSWRDIPHEMLPAGMKRARRSDHTKRYGRLNPNGVANTVMTKCDPHWGTVIHYSQDRVISVREAARFQSFPDAFVFYGPKASQYRQVGNAVPPLLAQALARQIKMHLADALAQRGYEIRKDRSFSNVNSGAF